MPSCVGFSVLGVFDGARRGREPCCPRTVVGGAPGCRLRAWGSPTGRSWELQPAQMWSDGKGQVQEEERRVRKMTSLQIVCVCTLTCLCRELVWKEGAQEGRPELGPRHCCGEERGHPGPYVTEVPETLSRLSHLGLPNVSSGGLCVNSEPVSAPLGRGLYRCKLIFPGRNLPPNPPLAGMANRLTHHSICPGLSEPKLGEAGSGSPCQLMSRREGFWLCCGTGPWSRLGQGIARQVHRKRVCPDCVLPLGQEQLDARPYRGKQPGQVAPPWSFSS